MFFVLLFLASVFIYIGIWFSFVLCIAVLSKKIYTPISLELVLAAITSSLGVTLLLLAAKFF